MVALITLQKPINQRHMSRTLFQTLGNERVQIPLKYVPNGNFKIRVATRGSHELDRNRSFTSISLARSTHGLKISEGHFGFL